MSHNYNGNSYAKNKAEQHLLIMFLVEYSCQNHHSIRFLMRASC